MSEIHIDRQARLFLAALDATGWPRMHERSPAQARRDLRLLADMTSGRQPVARVREAIGRDEDRAVRLRVYSPLRAPGARPLLVYFHGGGFVVGDLDTVDGVCRSLANMAGAVVASVDYRRAPEHPVPAAQQDALAAARWAIRHARQLGADPTRVAVGGDSVGGTLAAVVAQQTRGDGPNPIALQVLIYPATDFTFAAADRDPALAKLPTWQTVEWFASQSMRDADRRDPLISPAFMQDLSDLPPALVLTAAVDSFARDGRRYAERLRDAGVDVRIAEFEGQLHGFLTMDLVFLAAWRAQWLVARTVARMQPVSLTAPPASVEPVEWTSRGTLATRAVGQLWARHPAKLGAQWAGTLAQSQLQKTCRGAA